MLKFVSKAMLILALICTTVSMFMVPTFANDHTDRLFSFVFSTHNDKTEFAAKEDASPVYVKCQSASHPYYTHVLGGTVVGCAEDLTPNPYVTQTNSVLYIPVYYNQDYRYAVSGEETYWDSAAWGYWSPDSI